MHTMVGTIDAAAILRAGRGAARARAQARVLVLRPGRALQAAAAAAAEAAAAAARRLGWALLRWLTRSAYSFVEAAAR